MRGGASAEFALERIRMNSNLYWSVLGRKSRMELRVSSTRIKLKALNILLIMNGVSSCDEHKNIAKRGKTVLWGLRTDQAAVCCGIDVKLEQHMTSKIPRL